MSTKKIYLFVPCYVDHLFPEQADKACHILEHLGYDVEILPDQPCCGQIAYNSGYFDEARLFAKHWQNFFPSSVHVVVLGASCTHMVKNVYPTLFNDNKYSLLFFVEDFSSFIIKHRLEDYFSPKIQGRVAIHQSCTGLRKLYKGKNLTFEVLVQFPNLELIKTNVDYHCCGFGGTFSVKYPEISVDMGLFKLEKTCVEGAEYLIVSDVSCYMHLSAIQAKNSFPIQIWTLIDFFYQSIRK
ncbi:MAG: (Fe-S)-binding protein [Bacteroidales bacterium]|nr:(Fe-S)-binding protein [Bacteroidales bacterium]